jgi:hypothetical protein
VPYKVEDGDNFEELAIFAGWNAWDLIYYNFQTKDPREVNWYLRNYTGCVITTWDDKNFRFSSDADPGIIFFPMWAYKHLIDSGRTPKPFYSEDDEYHMPGPVPAVYQGFGQTCWAGAATSMIRWRRGGPSKIVDVLDGVGTSWRRKYETNQSLDSEEMIYFTGDCGLTGLLPGALPSDEREGGAVLQDLLRRHGPLMVVQDVSRAWNHWIVITGYRVEVPLTFNLRIMDPGNSSRRYRPTQSVLDDIHAVRGFWTKVYHW